MVATLERRRRRSSLSPRYNPVDEYSRPGAHSAAPIVAVDRRLFGGDLAGLGIDLFVDVSRGLRQLDRLQVVGVVLLLCGRRD